MSWQRDSPVRDLLVVGLLPEMDRGKQYEPQRCVAALEHENGRPDATTLTSVICTAPPSP